MNLLAAAAEPVIITGALVAVVAVMAVLVERIRPLRDWSDRITGRDRDLVVRRSESPTERYLRRQREQARAWGEVDR